MALENGLYIQSSVSGNAANPNNAIGFPDWGTPAGSSNDGVSWTHRWRLTDPTGDEIDPNVDSHVTFYFAKGNNTGNPSITGLAIYRNGDLLNSYAGPAAVTAINTWGEISLRFTGSGAARGFEIEVTTTGVGGSPKAKNSVLFGGAELRVNTIVLPPNVPPVANAGPDLSVPINTSFSIDGSGSYDPDGSIVKYNWKQAGQPIGLSSQAVYVNSIGLQDVMTQVYELTVTDNRGGVSTDSVRVTSYDPNAKPPVAVATGPSTAFVGDSVYMSGSKSYDPDAAPLEVLGYYWTKTSGPALQTWIGALTSDPYYVASEPGTYTFSLVVTDADGMNSAPAYVTTVISESAPAYGGWSIMENGTEVQVAFEGIMEGGFISTGSLTPYEPPTDGGEIIVEPVDPGGTT